MKPNTHNHHHHHHAGDNIGVAFSLNLAFTLLEIIGGLYTNSLAILSDAVHDLGDSLSLGLAWYLDRTSQRDADHRFTYGYRRFSLLGALITTIVLIAGSLYVLAQAIPRLIRPEPAHAPGMALFAVLGILVNGAAALRLRGDNSLNARMVAWHMIEDLLGWVAVLVVSITLLFFDLYILDPILSVLITLYVLYNVLRNLRKTLRLFLQAVPEQVDLAHIKERILAIEGVCDTHHTHVWSLDGDHHVLTTHVVVSEKTTREQILFIKQEINRLSVEQHLVHTTVEVEYQGELCSLPEPG